ncbi:hypothetical protein B0H67DRAFT_477352 [Lasiosphaeris hirsuta]|uniref:BPL/LPL catalytic domain-containing protein n=1 Tax=Lasiosphaeris hirsuta TaxID=260670 RepID=A0AA40B9G0_9PEZI|nr:hypothetical protein B0H67DRAFT_477352 [Lasiosphaeris hirsuta]
MRLRHLRLPHRAPLLHPPYSLASRIQEHLRRRQLDFKDAASANAANTNINTSPSAPLKPPLPPAPTLLSFSPLPTYTLGRRQTAPITVPEAARLQAPLRVTSSPGPGLDVLLPVALVHSPRGGLTTYHGPGQAVLWPVLDLRSPHHRQFTVRCYSRLLEDTTIETLWRLFGLKAFTTDDPGVWVRSRHATSTAMGGGDGDGTPQTAAAAAAKIAALGVHLRRHVSALGTALNVAMPGADVTDEVANPWARITACGLEGKTVTSVAGELLPSFRASLPGGGRGLLQEEVIAAAWAEELARRMGVEGVETVSAGEVVALVTEVMARAEDVTSEERAYVEKIQRGWIR